MDDALAGAATIEEARAAAAGCRACELWRLGTQTVFGDGPPEARLLLAGEQPGDHEDLAGQPFVGPAGRVLDAALADAGIDREDVYLTNAVKHFKWRPSGKRRIHDKPSWSQIQACRPWLDLELQLVGPEVVVLHPRRGPGGCVRRACRRPDGCAACSGRAGTPLSRWRTRCPTTSPV